MQKLPTVGQNMQCKLRHLVAKLGTNKSDATFKLISVRKIIQVTNSIPWVRCASGIRGLKASEAMDCKSNWESQLPQLHNFSTIYHWILWWGQEAQNEEKLTSLEDLLVWNYDPPTQDTRDTSVSKSHAFIEQDQSVFSRFVCNPGYQLVGPGQSICKGGSWSHGTSAPVCASENHPTRFY